VDVSEVTRQSPLAATQRAAVWHGRGDVRVQDWPLPAQPPAHWVRIKVAWCGLCGSDVTEFTKGPVVIPVDSPPLSGRGAPLVLGHEISGTIVASTDVTTPVIGERVVTDTLISCGRCAKCLRGEVNMCATLAVAGLSADGGLAEFVDVPASSCTVVPAHLGLDVAALAEPLAVALRAVSRAELRPEDQVVVVGLGAVGLLITMLLAEQRMIAVDPVPTRRRHASGRTGVVCHESLDDLDVGERRWVAFECTGNTRALNRVIECAPAQSRLVLVGVHGSRAAVDLNLFLHRELDMIASLSHSRHDMREAIRVLAARTELFRSLLTHTVVLDDTPAVLESLTRPETPVVKALIGEGGHRWHNARSSSDAS
jgi:(R,R)-butanediol dehydrogenase/meso-butanediol dehydrogenase/diacetyl reductase